MEQVREIGRAVIYGIIGGLVVTILAFWAGTRDPLTLLYEALAAFIVVAVAFEVVQRPWGRRLVPQLPFDVRISRRNALPKPPIVEVERGFLDYELDGMRGLAAANQLLDRISAEMARSARDTNTSAGRLAALAGAPIEKRHRGAKRAADTISAYATRLERLEMEYRGACQKMTSNFLNWFRTAPEGNDFASLDLTLVELTKIMKASKASTLGYHSAAQENRRTNVSQDVNRAIDRVIAVVDKLAEDADGIVKYCVEARAEIRKRGGPKRSTKP